MWFDTPSPALPTEILGQGHTLLLKVWSLGLISFLKFPVNLLAVIMGIF